MTGPTRRDDGHRLVQEPRLGVTFLLVTSPLDHRLSGWRACSTGAWAVDDLLLHIIAAVRHPPELERTGNFPIEAYSRLDIHTRHTAPIRVARAPLSPACQAAAVSLLRGAQSVGETLT